MGEEVMRLGPYRLGSNDENQGIYTGECSELMTILPDKCIDLTVTSPPYDNLRDYHGYTFDFEAIAAQLWRITKVGGVVVWVVGDATVNGSETGTSFRQALGFMELGFRLHDTMIYEKCGGGPPHSNRYVQAFEYMFVFSVGAPKSINLIKDRPNRWAGTSNFGRKTMRETDGRLTTRKKIFVVNKYGKRTNVWRVKNTFGFQSSDKSAHHHPATFPEALAHGHIMSWCNPGDIVLDPMIGSGTVAKMAKQLERHWLGFDISAEYVDLARQRVHQTQPPLFTLEQPKQSTLSELDMFSESP